MKFNAALFIVCLVGFFDAAANAAEFAIHPSLAASEEYNDNIFQTSEGRQTDYITRVLPGIALKYNALKWEWDIGYNFDYRHYARRSKGDETTHNLGAKGLITVIDNLLFLDIKDEYSRVSLDITRDVTQESLFVDQSDRNVLAASPYFVIRTGAQGTMKTGYRYVNTWYRESDGIDKAQHSGFMELNYELTPKMTLTAAGYTFTRQETRQNPEVNDFDSHNAFIGARYEYGDKSFIFGRAGNTWINYKSGIHFSNLFWDAGISHAFDTYVASFNTSAQYIEDPLQNISLETVFTGMLNKTFQRGNASIALTYSEFTDIETDTLMTRKYGAGIAASYELLPQFTGSLNFAAEKFDKKDQGSYTRRFFVNPGLAYSFPGDFTVSLNYDYVDYSSPGITADNWRGNRVIVEARKTF